MPCYRCGVRQIDPDRGESPWKRGVRADRQVLICPACQSSFDWTGDPTTALCVRPSTRRRLGEVECRDCGYVREPAGPIPGVTPGATPGADPAAASSDPDLGVTPGLAEEVELALAKVLGRAGRPARIS